jgi:hypothetical protein
MESKRHWSDTLFRLTGAVLVATTVHGIAFPMPSRACDTAMICAWKRTFYATNAVDSPLRAYFTPRRPNCNCAAGSIGWFPPAVSDGLSPPVFVRLGEIPNDMQLVGPPTTGQQ